MQKVVRLILSPFDEVVVVVSVRVDFLNQTILEAVSSF